MMGMVNCHHEVGETAGDRYVGGILTSKCRNLGTGQRARVTDRALVVPLRMPLL